MIASAAAGDTGAASELMTQQTSHNAWQMQQMTNNMNNQVHGFGRVHMAALPQSIAGAASRLAAPGWPPPNLALPPPAHPAPPPPHPSMMQSPMSQFAPWETQPMRPMLAPQPHAPPHMHAYPPPPPPVAAAAAAPPPPMYPPPMQPPPTHPPPAPAGFWSPGSTQPQVPAQQQPQQPQLQQPHQPHQPPPPPPPPAAVPTAAPMAAPTAEQLRADAMLAYEDYERVRDDPNSTENQQKKALREYGYRKMVYDRAVGGSDSDSE